MTFRSTRSLVVWRRLCCSPPRRGRCRAHLPTAHPLRDVDVDVDDRHFEKLPPHRSPSPRLPLTGLHPFNHVKYFPPSHPISPSHYSSPILVTHPPATHLLVTHSCYSSSSSSSIAHHAVYSPHRATCDVLIPFLTPTPFPFLLPVFYISSNFVCLFCYFLTASRCLLHPTPIFLLHLYISKNFLQLRCISTPPSSSSDFFFQLLCYPHTIVTPHPLISIRFLLSPYSSCPYFFSSICLSYPSNHASLFFAILSPRSPFFYSYSSYSSSPLLTKLFTYLATLTYMITCPLAFLYIQYLTIHNVFKFVQAPNRNSRC